MERPLRVLQIGSSDVGGGAQLVARGLHDGYRARGIEAWLAVGHKRSADPNVFEVPNEAARNTWARAAHRFARAPARNRWARSLSIASAEPLRWLRRRYGEEDFDFPGTAAIPGLPPARPDVIQAHNLHGEYFDLRVLAEWSPRIPLLLTLHDAWLLSGHCAHSFDCRRWQSGCGDCPDLSIYPSIARDGTARNWRRKRDIFARARVRVATPSRWLMDKVQHSLLADAIIERRVIPNGVDRSVFTPSTEQRRIRTKLGLPPSVTVLLFSAWAARTNPFKDYATAHEAVRRVAARLKQPFLLVALGDAGEPEQIGDGQIMFVPFVHSPQEVASYYQAADIYVHASRADTFPSAVIEAMACGTAVVASNVGGIPEQVIDRETGLLVAPGDPEALADCLIDLISQPDKRRALGTRGAEVVAGRFDLDRQVDTYVDWMSSFAINDRHVSLG